MLFNTEFILIAFFFTMPIRRKTPISAIS